MNILSFKTKPTHFKNPIPCPVCKAVKEYKNDQGRTCLYGQCEQCNGYGYVEKDSQDATCIHWFPQSLSFKIGNCLTRSTCSKCGVTRDIDSSD